MTLPNFLVLGAPRCGTTSIHYNLLGHPDIFLCAKQMHFFLVEDDDTTNARIKTLDEYEKLFAGAGGFKSFGEVATDYLYVPAAADNIRRVIPDARLIASLRDPADRAFSHYLMHYRLGKIPGSGKTPSIAQLESGLADPDALYVRIGFYYRHLRRYYDRFEHDQIRAYLFEDLDLNTRSVMKDMFNFLGVDPAYEPDTERRYNIGSSARFNPGFKAIRNSAPFKIVQRHILSKGVWKYFHKWWTGRQSATTGEDNFGMPVEIREKLVGVYQDDILRLQELIQRDLSAWLEIEKPDKRRSAGI